jgi:lysophospholipase L1-like esterase
VRRSRLVAGAVATALAVTAALTVTTVTAMTATSVTAATAATGPPMARPVPAVMLLVAAAPVRYVALGDSYSAGTGAGDYGSSGSCERSADAYPEQWADHHATASFVSVACSGATTSGVLSSQLTALNARTTLVSITVGGNDAGFAHVMEICVFEWDRACLNAVSSAEAFAAGTLPGRFDLSASPDCIGLSTTKRTALNRGADDLDRALAAAAARYGDVFADVRGQFAGHEICDSVSWLHALTFPIGDSYHPTAAGQELGYLPVFTAAAG